MKKLIYLEDAIDALERTKEKNPKGYIARFYNTIIDNKITVIKDLPSAQPEIIRCKDCKHHWTYKCMDSMPIETCDLEQTFYDIEHDFCSMAERRNDD